MFLKVRNSKGEVEVFLKTRAKDVKHYDGYYITEDGKTFRAYSGSCLLAVVLSEDAAIGAINGHRSTKGKGSARIEWFQPIKTHNWMA